MVAWGGRGKDDRKQNTSQPIPPSQKKLAQNKVFVSKGLESPRKEFRLAAQLEKAEEM
jgi:hypothetical protein